MKRPPASSLGRFVWHELFTPDVETTKAFYAELLGWTFDEVATAHGPYTTVIVDGIARAGVCSTPHLQVPAHFMGYVAVEDLETAAQATVRAGGSVLGGPLETPVVGPQLIVSDATGANLSLVPAGPRWQLDDLDASAPRSLGSLSWNQLSSSDPERAKAFYAEVLGWAPLPFGRGLDIEGLGRPQEPLAAGLLAGSARVPSHWLTYLAVEDMTAARWRLRKLGGKLLLDDAPVPGLGIISIFRDKTGAVAGLLAPWPTKGAEPQIQ